MLCGVRIWRLLLVRFVLMAEGGVASDAVSASPPMPFPLTELPSELLPLIFRHIPKRPRFLVVSLVCRRWRKAVLQVPVHLQAMSRARIVAATNLVPCRSLVADEHCPSAPTTLRSLAVCKAPPGSCHCSAFRDLSCLGSLVISCGTGTETGTSLRCECIAPLLRNNKSLTRLCLRLEGSPGPAFAALFPALHLTALSSLRIVPAHQYGWHDAESEWQVSTGADRPEDRHTDFSSFVRAHSDNLASLTLLGGPSRALISSAGFARLVRLETTLPALLIASVASLRERCPCLASVKALVPHYWRAHHAAQHAEQLAQLVPLVTALACPANASGMEQFTNVRSLELEQEGALTRFAAVLPSLTALDVRRTGVDLDMALLRTMAALTRLHAAYDKFPASGWPAAMCLTRLRVLRLSYVSGPSRPRSHAVLCDLHRVFPAITSLSLCAVDFSRAELRALNAFLAVQDERRVLRRVLLVGRPFSNMVASAELNTALYRWVDVRTNVHYDELVRNDMDDFEDSEEAGDLL